MKHSRGVTVDLLFNQQLLTKGLEMSEDESRWQQDDGQALLFGLTTVCAWGPELGEALK